jgi:hypothetical protein
MPFAARKVYGLTHYIHTQSHVRASMNHNLDDSNDPYSSGRASSLDKSFSMDRSGLRKAVQVRNGKATACTFPFMAYSCSLSSGPISNKCMRMKAFIW